jgi:hypothetical protein
MRLRRSLAASLVTAALLASCANHHHAVRSPRSPMTSTPVANGVVNGRLVARHLKGPGSGGTGPVAGTVTARNPAGVVVSQVPASVSGFSLALAPGSYLLGATVRDGSCRLFPVTVRSGGETALAMDCVDGLSTD